MSKVQFQKVGKGESGMNKKGTEYVHISIDEKMVSRIAPHDFANIYIFADKNGDGYIVMAPVQKESEGK